MVAVLWNELVGVKEYLDELCVGNSFTTYATLVEERLFKAGPYFRVAHIDVIFAFHFTSSSNKLFLYL